MVRYVRRSQRNASRLRLGNKKSGRLVFPCSCVSDLPLKLSAVLVRLPSRLCVPGVCQLS
jgi:hypothetical protein